MRSPPHSKCLSPHVANGDKVGHRCCRRIKFKINLFFSKDVFLLQIKVLMFYRQFYFYRIKSFQWRRKRDYEKSTHSQTLGLDEIDVKLLTFFLFYFLIDWFLPLIVIMGNVISFANQAINANTKLNQKCLATKWCYKAVFP